MRNVQLALYKSLVRPYLESGLESLLIQRCKGDWGCSAMG